MPIKESLSFDKIMQATTSIQAGMHAPEFTSLLTTGDVVSLNDFKGKKVVLYFYPKDDTPGCTAQACNLRDNYTALIKSGYVVIGVSADNVKSHKKFEQIGRAHV